MIKNDANKCAKKALTSTTTTTTTTTTPAAPIPIRQPVTEVDNRRTNQTTKCNENVDEEADTVKPLSKIDLIKKFDSKYHQSTEDAVDNKQSLKQTVDSNQKYSNTNIDDIANPDDEIENDENIQNSNDDEFEYKTRTSEYETAANNNYKNGNNEAIVPPKPLPRTSRNNSVSSLSSESGSLSAVNANVQDEANRPIAKPRTTTTSYKVPTKPNSHFLSSKKLNFSQHTHQIENTFDNNF